MSYCGARHGLGAISGRDRTSPLVSRLNTGPPSGIALNPNITRILMKRVLGPTSISLDFVSSLVVEIVGDLEPYVERVDRDISGQPAQGGQHGAQLIAFGARRQYLSRPEVDATHGLVGVQTGHQDPGRCVFLALCCYGLEGSEPGGLHTKSFYRYF